MPALAVGRRGPVLGCGRGGGADCGREGAGCGRAAAGAGARKVVSALLCSRSRRISCTERGSAFDLESGDGFRERGCGAPWSSRHESASGAAWVSVADFERNQERTFRRLLPIGADASRANSLSKPLWQ